MSTEEKSNTIDGSAHSNMETRLSIVEQKLTRKLGFWQKDISLLIAVTGAALGIIGHAVVAFIETDANLKLEQVRLQHELILSVVEDVDIDRAKKNLKFIIDAGILRNSEFIDTGKIRSYIFEERNDPLIISRGRSHTCLLNDGKVYCWEGKETLAE